VARSKRRNPWISVGEVFTWVLFALLLFPAVFAGWAVGHYTSLGGEKGTVTHTVTQTATTTVAGSTTAASTAAETTAPATTNASTTAAATTAASAAGNPTLGKAVFASSGCGSCHTFAPANASGTVGPDLDTAPQQDAQRANMPLGAFVRQSIVDPNAYVPSGYAKGVMPQNFGQQLSPSQLYDLVAFLVQGAQ
jgi:cytochrome c551/c552